MDRSGVEFAAQRYHDRVASLLIGDEMSQAEVAEAQSAAYDKMELRLQDERPLFDELVLDELVNDQAFLNLLRDAWDNAPSQRYARNMGDAMAIGDRLIRAVQTAADAICLRAARGEE